MPFANFANTSKFSVIKEAYGELCKGYAMKVKL